MLDTMQVANQPKGALQPYILALVKQDLAFCRLYRFQLIILNYRFMKVYR